MMKKNLKTKLLFLLLILTTSCVKENSTKNLFEGVGDIKAVDATSATLMLDNLDTLQITNSSEYNLDVDQRVTFIGKIVNARKDGDYSFYTFDAVVVNLVEKKNILLQSDLTTEEIDSLGGNNIYVEECSMTNKYLNINYLISKNDIYLEDNVSMILDNTKGNIAYSNGVLTTNMTLLYNAEGNAGAYMTRGFTSFKIDGLLSNYEDIKKIIINLKYQTSETTSGEIKLEKYI